MIDAVFGIFGIGRLYLDVQLDGEPVGGLAQLCMIRDGAPTFSMSSAEIAEAIRRQPMIDTRLPGTRSLLDTSGRWVGALVKAGTFRAFVRFNKVDELAGRAGAAEYCFEVDGGPIHLDAGQRVHRIANASRVPRDA